MRISKPNIQVFWYKDNNLLHQNSDIQFTSESDINGHIELTMKSASYNDNGIYKVTLGLGPDDSSLSSAKVEISRK